MITRPQLKEGEKHFFISWAIPGSVEGPDLVVTDLQKALVNHLENKGLGTFWVKCYKKPLVTGWAAVDLGPDVYFPERKWAVFSFFTSTRGLEELKAEANAFIGPYHNQFSLEVVSDSEGELFSCPFGFTKKGLNGDCRTIVQRSCDELEEKKASLPSFLANMPEDELSLILAKAAELRNADKDHRAMLMAQDLKDLKNAMEATIKARDESLNCEPNT